MYNADKITEADGQCLRYTILQNTIPLRFMDALALMRESAEFRSFLIDILRDCPFAAYRWETPVVTRATATRGFEFALVNAPEIDRAPNAHVFREYFNEETEDAYGIVPVVSLGGDALLLIPSPRAADACYRHLAAFVRHAPIAQVHALWDAVGRSVDERLSDRPLWLNTAGGGVTWLHVRLDSRPKYYAYTRYKAC